MSESIILHFAKSRWDEIVPWLDEHAVLVDDRRWNYPEPFDPLLYAYAYDDHRSEFGPDDLGRLIRLLGSYPASALCLQLRSIHGDASCDAAAGLAIELLREFDGIADDTFAHDGAGYWLLADLEAGSIRQHGRFLDCYRSRPSTCRDEDCA
jgi:hypothetical protein